MDTPAPIPFSESLKARLRGYLRHKHEGLHLASRLNGALGVADAEEALRRAYQEGVLGNLELNVIVARWIQAQPRAVIAEQEGVSEATVKRALRSATAALDAWAQGRRAAL